MLLKRQDKNICFISKRSDYYILFIFSIFEIFVYDILVIIFTNASPIYIWNLQMKLLISDFLINIYLFLLYLGVLYIGQLYS